MLEIEPGEADQVTAVFDVLVTRAVNGTVPADASVAVAGDTVTVTTGLDDAGFAGTETPEQAARKKSENAKMIKAVQWDTLVRCKRRRFQAGVYARRDIRAHLEWGFWEINI